jgi:two-component system, cell cycle response regulator
MMIKSKWATQTDRIPGDREITEVERVDGDSEATTPIIGATFSVLRGSEAGRFEFVDGKGGVFGRGDEADYQFADTTVSRSHAKVSLRRGYFFLEDLESANGTWLDGEKVEGEVRLPYSCRVQLGTRILLQFTAVDQMGADAFGKLRRALFIDPLTGVGNRAYLDMRLAEETAFAFRHRQRIGILLADLDHFKDVNDTHGHAAGDLLLTEVGKLLQYCVRTEDSVFRYGGEEFCVLVRGEDVPGLVIMAERIRSAVGQFALEFEGGAIRITASLGVASEVPDQAVPQKTVPGETLDDSADQPLFVRADAALYRAKQGGRDRVEVSEVTEDLP